MLSVEFGGVDKFSEAKKNSGVAVVATAMTDGQCVGVSSKRYSWSLWVSAPYSDDTVAADIGVDLGRMQTLQVADNHIVCELLAPRRLRMLMQLMPNLFIVNHSNVKR